MKILQLGYCALLAVALTACDDNNKPANPDAPPAPTDAAIDSAPQGFQKPTAVRIRIADTNPDQMHSVAAGPAGSFYMAGFFTRTPTGPRILSVVKVQGTGVPDTTFGDGGNAYDDNFTLATGGINDEIDVVVQGDGKILVSATIPAVTANPDDGDDRDIAIVRLTTTGARDATFGTGGVVRLSLGVSKAGTAVTRDGVRSIAVNDSGIYVHANARALDAAGAAQDDSDFVVLKLSPVDGSLDTNFGNSILAATEGQFRHDIARSNATPRQIRTLPDGKLLVGGYASSTVVGGKTQPVIYKLTAEGKLDAGFATAGVFHSTILAQQTEVYGFAIHGDKFVTAGYGRNDTAMNAPNSYVSLRFNLSDGTRDLTWGTDGAVVFDPSGAGLTSNCRSAIALPDGKTLLVGSTGAANTQAQDAVFAVLDAEGKLDTSFGASAHTYKLGTDGFDQFWSGAVTTDGKIVVIGWKAVADQTATSNDDSFGLLFSQP